MATIEPMTVPPKTLSMERADESSNCNAPHTSHSPINFQASKLGSFESRPDAVGGLSLLCNFGEANLNIDARGLPNRLVVVLNTSPLAAFQFLLLTGVVPGLASIGCNCVGSIDELHFVRQPDMTVNMTRIRR